MIRSQVLAFWSSTLPKQPDLPLFINLQKPSLRLQVGIA
jgi:hypothetical protein